MAEARVWVMRASGEVILDDVRVARTFWQRLMGLMGKQHLHPGEGLWIPRCRAVHCCFMRTPIDVLFLDDQGRILRVLPCMKPWTFSPYVDRAQAVLECAAGTAAALGLRPGERLTWREVEKSRSGPLDGGFGSV
ncbi:DUF192 domain-containing protein [Alicyclobacillus sp.]|uniref:DUF192 domain-containing protein n=1 Tax=Alicyclobacillus sp. TaxID=61169 RepID=UPI0025C29DEE|nr:DUF192 domain-containing protein [Alicyclobacillus sp.]MCL6517833.1 DUF192 domain-containing protein [Alicyclobacillus sp.]